MDMNGNGFLSLAEVDKGIVSILNLPQLFDLKPVIMRAFTAAKNACPSKSKKGSEYVEAKEYRLLLKYLRQYYEYWVAFDRIDTDGDRRITFIEFSKAIPMMQKWGIKITNP